MIQMIVFDMAGTTIDEKNIVYKTLQQSINAWGFNFSLDQVLEKGAGKEKLQAVKDILSSYSGNVDEQLADEIHGDFLIQLKNAYLINEIIPQPHTLELFDYLRAHNIYIVLNTGYDSKTAESLILKLGWAQHREFDLLISAGDVNHNRPFPDMIHLAMQRLHITDSQKIIKVGDSIIDIEEGKNADCLLSIGITTGAHTKSQLLSAFPDYIIDDLLEIIPIVSALQTP